MARIFTTKFLFNHQVYDAIVTMAGQEGQVHFHVKLMDEALQALLPGGSFSYESREKLHTIEHDDPMMLALMQSVSASIQEHLVLLPRNI